jgi:ABC-type amino acid transport substrate-binding protein
MHTYFARLRAMLRAGSLVVLAALGLAACGGSGDSSAPAPSTPSATSDTGTLLISLTDADGDFVGYSVDVLSVTLQRLGGGTVEVGPARRGNARTGRHRRR